MYCKFGAFGSVLGYHFDRSGANQASRISSFIINDTRNSQVEVDSCTIRLFITSFFWNHCVHPHLVTYFDLWIAFDSISMGNPWHWLYMYMDGARDWMYSSSSYWILFSFVNGL